MKKEKLVLIFEEDINGKFKYTLINIKVFYNKCIPYT